MLDVPILLARFEVLSQLDACQVSFVPSLRTRIRVLPFRDVDVSLITILSCSKLRHLAVVNKLLGITNVSGLRAQLHDAEDSTTVDAEDSALPGERGGGSCCSDDVVGSSA